MPQDSTFQKYSVSEKLLPGEVKLQKFRAVPESRRRGSGFVQEDAFLCPPLLLLGVCGLPPSPLNRLNSNNNINILRNHKTGTVLRLMEVQ